MASNNSNISAADIFRILEENPELKVESIEMPLGARIVWDILFGGMLFVAVVGNLIVLWIVIAHRYMRTIPNTFIANMSLSDLLMAVLNCSFNYVTMRDRRWGFGQVYCTVNNFMAIVSVSTSVLNLTAMSLDRYKAIVWPLKMRTSKYVVAGTIMAIWIGSALFAMPALQYSTIVNIVPGQPICYIKWPDDHMGTSYYDYIYNVCILLVTYVIPICIIGVITIHMTTVLWCRQPLCIITPQLELAKRKKQKIVKMLVVLIVIFGVCWLPYHVYFLYSYHFPEVRSLSYIQHVFLGFYWCAMAHSMVNPIVYYFMNPRFRHYYQHILTFRWLHPRQPDAPTGLILASTFGLQVAAHLALDHHHEASQIEDMEDDVVGNGNLHPATDSTRRASFEKIERIPSRTTQTSSVSSSITSRRKILTLGSSHAPDPDIIITSQLEEAEPLTPVSEPVKDNLVPALSPILSHQTRASRRLSDALAMAIKTSESFHSLRRPSMRSSLLLLHKEEAAEDLLDISRENALEIAASCAAINERNVILPKKKGYSTSLFPRITQV